MKVKYIIIILSLLCVIFLGCVDKTPENEEGGASKMSLEDKRILMVIPPEDFRDEEFFKPLNVFKEVDAKVIVASREVSKAVGVLGSEVLIDINISNVNVDDYDVIVFVGGPGASVYFNDPSVLLIVKEAYDKGRLVAAICIAPVILGNANILEGREATVWSSLTNKEYVNKIKEKGVKYVNKDVVQDGKIITANGPDAAEKFAKKILENLRD